MSIIKNTVQVWAPNEQVTAAKLNNVIAEAVFDTGAVAAGGEIVVNSLGELEIPDGSLNAGKLANNAVETDKINALAVTNPKIAEGVVTPGKLSTGKPTWDTNGNLTTGGNEIRTLNVTQKVDDGFLRLWGGTFANGAHIVLYGESHDTAPGIIQIRADEYRLRNISGSEQIRITSSGDVGIGTTNPAAKLHVIGALSAMPAVGATSKAIIFNHLYSIYADNTGAGAHNTRLWFDAPDAGEMIFGPRTGGNFLHLCRIRANTTTLESSGGVSVGTNAFPNAAAMLDVVSTTKGFLPPRMTQTQRNAISSPPAGLILYNSTTNKLQVRTNTAWVDLH